MASNQPNGQLPEPGKRPLIGWILLAALNCAVLLGYLAAHHDFPGDFAAFYVATQAYQQDPRLLYDLSLQKQIEQSLIGRQDIPFNHPPYELLVWLPLARFQLQTAFWIWRAVGLLMLAVASWLLAHSLSQRYETVSIFTISMAFFPVPYSLWMGQDSVLMLTIFAACSWSLHSRYDFMAGIALGLGLFKFQLILPFAAVYILWRRWRLLAGFLSSAITVACVSFLMVGYSGMRALMLILVKGQTTASMAVHPATMPNLRGLSVLLLGGHPKVALALALIGSGALLLLAASAATKDQLPERGFACLVCFVILVSFHINLHDLALLTLPILVALADGMRPAKGRWKVVLPLVVLFCMPLYILAIGAFNAALFAVVVAWLWYAMNDALKSQAPVLEGRAG